MLSSPVKGYNGKVDQLLAYLDMIISFVLLQCLLELGECQCVIQGNQALSAEVSMIPLLYRYDTAMISMWFYCQYHYVVGGRGKVLFGVSREANYSSSWCQLEWIRIEGLFNAFLCALYTTSFP